MNALFETRKIELSVIAAINSIHRLLDGFRGIAIGFLDQLEQVLFQSGRIDGGKAAAQACIGSLHTESCGSPDAGGSRDAFWKLFCSRGDFIVQLDRGPGQSFAQTFDFENHLVDA